MSKIEFTVEINPEKKEVALAAMALIAAMAELDLEDVTKPRVEVRSLKVVEPEEVKPEADKVEEEAPKKKRASKKVTPKKAEPEAEETTEELEEQPAKVNIFKKKNDEKASKPAKGTDPEVTVEDIRRLLKDLVRDHRDGIESKLVELGASSASTLDEEHFGEFYTYLESLKDE